MMLVTTATNERLSVTEELHTGKTDTDGSAFLHGDQKSSADNSVCRNSGGLDLSHLTYAHPSHCCIPPLPQQHRGRTEYRKA